MSTDSHKGSIFDNIKTDKKATNPFAGFTKKASSPITISSDVEIKIDENKIINQQAPKPAPIKQAHSPASSGGASQTEFLKKYIENQKKQTSDQLKQSAKSYPTKIPANLAQPQQLNPETTPTASGVGENNALNTTSNSAFNAKHKINKTAILKGIIHQSQDAKLKNESNEKKSKHHQKHSKHEQIEDGAEYQNEKNEIVIEIENVVSSASEDEESVEEQKQSHRDNTQINKILNEFEYEEFDGDVSALIEGKNLRAQIEAMRDDSVSFDEYNDTADTATDGDRKKEVKKTSRFKHAKKPKHKQNNAFAPQAVFIKRTAIVYDAISITTLARQVSVKTKDIEKILTSLGIDAEDDYMIDFETAEIITAELGHDIRKAANIDEIADEFEDHKKNVQFCGPVVTIMGHVDHGKTTLLDTIRKADVALSEHGGITQHIGAYKVLLESGQQITFLDTPGHAAFSQMRIRGASATNVVVLVVAADDGIMQQTAEAISHAKAAGVPIIVAINKIDAPSADVSRVKNELLKYDLITEELGGDVMAVPISAKLNQNIDKLLEAILLQTEMLDIKRDLAAKPSGLIIEANIDKQKGIICTALLQNGTLRKGDIIVAGEAYGKIRQMFDDTNTAHNEITPQTPVQIFGFSSLPKAGDKFFFAKNERAAKQITDYKRYKALNAKKVDRNLIHENEGKKQINIIIKSDTQGTKEAIVGFISTIELPSDVAIKVIHSGVGNINESDVLLAKGDAAYIFGFNIKTDNKCEQDIKKYSIFVKTYSVIYEVFDEIKSIIESKKEKVKVYTKIGTAEVREVFNISGRGKIAGCMVMDGIIKQKSVVKVVRAGIAIFEGTISNLKRLKENVAEVNQGFECGIQIHDFELISKLDLIEVYDVKQV